MWEGFVDYVDKLIIVQTGSGKVGYYLGGKLVLVDDDTDAISLVEAIGVPFTVEKWDNAPDPLPKQHVDLYSTK